MRSPWIGAVTACVLGVLLPRQPEQWSYRFDAEKELADFEVVSGGWKVSAGDLWCTSKGAREELRWRRALTASGSASVKLVGAGRVGFAFFGGGQETVVRVDRGDARVVVEIGGKVALERPFEAAPATPVALAVEWTPARLLVRVGDDEPLPVERPAEAAPFAKLSLLSLKSQPRLDDFVVVREAAAPAATDPAAEGAAGVQPRVAPLTEDLRLAIERASASAASDPEKAFEQLVPALPKPPASGELRLPDPALALLQQLALAKPSLRGKPPLAELIADATLAANDGSATLVLPLHSGWTAKAPELRRKEGVIFEAKSASPALELQVFRYDPQIQYAFGSNPKLVLTTGGGGPTLGHAKADDEKARHPGAEFARPFDKSRSALGGETAYEYVLTWPDPAPDSGAGAGAGDVARVQALRELFVLHGGDTWQVTIRGFKVDLELASADVEWLLANLRFERS